MNTMIKRKQGLRHRFFIARAAKLFAALLLSMSVFSNALLWSASPPHDTSNQPRSLIFAGDTALARNAGQFVKTFGPAFPIGDTGEILRTADLFLLNLECAVARSGKPWMDPPNPVYLRSDPETIEVFKEAGVDYVSLANNHSLDFGYEGLFETMEHLSEAGIKFSGAGKTTLEAKKPAAAGAGGISAAVFSATDNAPPYAARESGPGTWYFEIPPPEEFFTRLRGEINSLRLEGISLFIFSIHWGPNMVETPSDEIKTFAHRLIEEGVDIIHGHSAHVFQGIEVYHGKIIFYGTGDFINDFLPVAGTEEQFLYKVIVEPSGEKFRAELKQIELIPIKIENMQAKLAGGPAADRMLTKMRARSAEFGTEIRSNGSTGVIEIKKEP